MNQQNSLRSAARGCASLIVLTGITSAHAAGFYVPPKGPAGVGLANIGNAVRANDGNTVYANPAGMVLLDGALLQGGFDFIIPDINIIDNGSTATTPGTLGASLPYEGTNGIAGELTPIPNVYYARPLQDGELWFGLAVTAPFGLSLDYGDTWFGRYDSIKSELITVNIAPTFAYKINDSWSIGGGINLEYADATLSNAVANTLNPGGPSAATDGFAKVSGDAWDVGFNIGLLYNSDSTRIGLHYRSAIDHRLDGSTTIAGLTGPLAGGNGDFATSVDLELPAIASIAVARNLSEKITLFADVQWFGWNSFDEIRIKFDNGAPDNVRPQGFRNSISGGFSVEYEWSSQWTMRTGIQFDKTPTVDQYRNTSIPDNDQVWFGFGATYTHSDRLLIGLGYVHSEFDAADIDLRVPLFAGTPAGGIVNVRGRTDNQVDVISVDVRYRF